MGSRTAAGPFFRQLNQTCPDRVLPESHRISLLAAAGKISRPDKKEIKKRNKDKKAQKRNAIVEKERRLRASTGIRRAREDAIFTAPQQICWSTHTAASDLDKYGIYINAMDTGWVPCPVIRPMPIIPCLFTG